MKSEAKKVHNTTLHPSRSSALKRAWQLSGVKALLSYLKVQTQEWMETLEKTLEQKRRVLGNLGG